MLEHSTLTESGAAAYFDCKLEPNNIPKTKNMTIRSFWLALLVAVFIPNVTTTPVAYEADLMDLEPSPFITENDSNIQSTIVTSHLMSDDDLDSNLDALPRRHRHHHHHHHQKHGQESENDNQAESNPVQRIYIASEHAEMCSRGRMSDINGFTWKNGECETCQCEKRQVICEQEPCPDLPCEDPVPVEGECCQMCPEKLCQAADGRHFADGAEWHLDDCTFCECRKGRVLCSVEDCEFKACANPTKVPGRCCPVCPDRSCHEDNGSNHTAGDVWEEGQCTHCYCRKGEKVCADEKCPHINCSDAYRRPGECCARCPGALDCVLSTWGSWSECPIQECGGGMQRRYRSVVVHPKKGGSFCPHMSEAKMCPKLPCNEIPVCPVSSWETWGHCSATCGSGRRLRMRQRTKVTKATMTSLIDCSDTHLQESMPCYTGSCNLSPAMLMNAEPDMDHCLQMRWTEWGPCSVACGVGLRTRQQVLINSSHPLGHLCHLLQETKQCHGHDCSGSTGSPVNCKVTPWSSWTPCSASCGGNAAKSKHRSILRQNSVGGRSCPQLSASRPCRLDPCPLTLELNLYADDQCMSQDDGIKHYTEGERWKPEKCTSCQCVNSRKVCQPIECPKQECSNPVEMPGFCCLFCIGQ
ncbi:kielin/chordin-like protein [Clavelina lepadiformis]|uniref:kielin/chordin-like protein n=1 Tax=Clavelina lepadiformis TaxID=159417 RepID=UPI004041419D